MRRRVVITGLGTVNPCGLDTASTWGAVLAGRSGIGPITSFDASDLPVRIAGEVRGFDGAALLGAREVLRVGRYAQLAVAACDEALRDAGFERGGRWPEAERFGVYVGTGIGGIPEIYEQSGVVHREGARSVSAFFIPRSLNNLAGGALAIRYNAQGPSVCIATACATGNHSIGEGMRAIRDGAADVLLAGGTEAVIGPLGLGGFLAMRALSKRNDDPAGASRPFDSGRDGFVMSEGAGVVVLEALEHAVTRGARIYGELIGYGASTDAHHITAPAPDGRGARRCMLEALRDAGITPDDVDYINAHGTSTPLNDRTETVAIHAVFGEHARRLLVSSTKSVTGHLLGAAGGLEAVLVAKTLQTGWVPPTINLTEPDPACDLDYVAGGARETQPRVALSNAFGFGGTNATIVVRSLAGADL